ncbi:MAG: ABC transporter permease, partial [Pseudomonadales bacterium]|nr:ABC transporter permease [Pseudomonadales bacterium]
MHPLNRKIQRDLLRLRGQSLAIALIVASGVGVLVMSLAAMQALTDTAAAYYERYQFADVFADATRAPRKVLREIEALPGVRIAEGRIVKYA